MQRQKLIVGLALVVACLLGARDASAGASCTTRSNCFTLSKRFVAQAHVSCNLGIPVPMCAKREARCGNVEANCNYTACPIGGGRARATNGVAGCVTSFDRSGMGLAGDASFEGAFDPDLVFSEGDHGDGEVLTNVHFDEVAQTVEIRLESGRLAATPGGLGSRLTAWIFIDESEGDDEEPTPTAATTLWTGSVTLVGGELTVTGFDPTLFTLSTDDAGRTVVTFKGGITIVDIIDLLKTDFGKVAVKILTDEVAP